MKIAIFFAAVSAASFLIAVIVSTIRNHNRQRQRTHDVRLAIREDVANSQKQGYVFTTLYHVMDITNMAREAGFVLTEYDLLMVIRDIKSNFTYEVGIPRHVIVEAVKRQIERRNNPNE